MEDLITEKGWVGANYRNSWYLYDVTGKKFAVYNSRENMELNLHTTLEDIEILPEPDFIGETGAAAITLTTRCNMECPYCFVKPVSSETDMPVEVVKDAVNALGKQTKNDLTLFAWGGEPTQNPKGLLAMISEAEKYSHIKICLVTNGVIEEKLLEKLLLFKNLVFQISFDGLISHDKQKPLRKPGKSLSYVLNNVERITRETKRIAFRVTVTTDNIDELNYFLLPTVSKYTNRLMIEHLHSFNGKAVGLESFAPDIEAFTEFVFKTIPIAESQGIHVKVLPLDHLRAGGPNDKMTFLNILSDRKVIVSNAVIESKHPHFSQVYIGDLNGDTIQYNSAHGKVLEKRYMKYYKSECNNCAVRPVCRGSIQRYLFITSEKLENWNNLRCRYYISLFKRWLYTMAQKITKSGDPFFEGYVQLEYPTDKVHYPMFVLKNGLSFKYKMFNE